MVNHSNFPKAILVVLSLFVVLLTASRVQALTNAPTIGKVILVTNLKAEGPGSLKQALDNASDGDEIRYDETLSGDAATVGAVTKSVTITLPSSKKVVFRNVVLGPARETTLVLRNAVFILDKQVYPNELFGVSVNATAKLYNVTLNVVDIPVYDGARLELNDSLIQRGTIEGGEGVFVTINSSTFDESFNSIVTGERSIVSINSSTFYASGGVFSAYLRTGLPANRPKVTITQSTLLPKVQVIFSNADVTLSNTLLYVDIPGDFDFCRKITLIDGGGNLFSKSVSACNPSIHTGTVKIGLLRNNGGSTPTVALLPGSDDAIGKADVAICIKALQGGRDQRGALLPLVNGIISKCDIGAYQTSAIPATSPSN
jgi:hypothetical protein